MSYVDLGRKYVDQIGDYLEYKWVRSVIVVGLVVSATVGGYYWYHNFTFKRQGGAVAAFDQATQIYYKAIAAELGVGDKDTEASWSEVEMVFDTAFQEHKNSSFAPYFLIYQAQALANQKKYDLAAKAAGQALSQLNQSSPFYDLYQILHASILLDSGNQAGVLELQSVIGRNGAYQQMAQYYLAQYHLSLGETEIATKLFREIAESPIEYEFQGSWAKLASSYL